MSRGFPASYVAALNAGAYRPVTFAQLGYTGGTMYLHDSIGTIDWGGNSWLGVGVFGGISAIEEGSDTTPYALRLSLSGVDVSLATEVLRGEFSQQPVTLYFGLLGDGQYLLGETGTAQAGSATTITLASGANTANDYYNGRALRLLTGPGAGQIVAVLDYVGATRVATVSPSFAVNPASGTVYSIDDLPVEIWAGTSDVTTIARSAQTATIEMVCESELARGDRASGRMFSDAQIRSRFPDDTFFSFGPSVIDLVISWKETTGSSAGSSSSSFAYFPRA